MKTVTVCCYRRPEYTRRCLEALAKCRDVESWQVIVSVDAPRTPEVAEAAKETYAAVSEYRYDLGLLGMLLFQQQAHAGVAEHPKKLYDTAFDMIGSEFNVAIEDDCVLSPDALELADKYRIMSNGVPWDAGLFLSLGDSRREHADPAVLNIRREITSPWAWAFSKYAWQQIRPVWNAKQEPPVGWDWSLTYAMAVNDWTALTPAESRALNIGREAGEHGGAGEWDEKWAQAVASDGSYTGPYQIEDGGDERWKPWMEAEQSL